MNKLTPKVIAAVLIDIIIYFLGLVGLNDLVSAVDFKEMISQFANAIVTVVFTAFWLYKILNKPQNKEKIRLAFSKFFVRKSN